jgi:biopolymer transport protein ExbD
MHFTPPRPKNEDDHILPLINVVFLLLIFFMLAGSLSASDPFKIDPAHSASQASPGEMDVQILMGSDGQIALDGVVVSQSDLIATLTPRLAENPEILVRLRADGGINATEVISVMEKLHKIGVSRLKLLTVPAPETEVVQ